MTASSQDVQQAASVTREELYALVWAQPMLKVAQKFDVSSSNPKLGVLFISQHYLDRQAGSATQAAYFAKCDFAWSGKP